MSAFVVQPEHIDVMVWIGSQPAGHIGPLRWYFGNPARMNELRADTRDQVGQILLDENATSVNYRYSENNTYTYQYEHPQHTGWTAPSAPRRPFPPGYTYASSAFQATVPSA